MTDPEIPIYTQAEFDMAGEGPAYRGLRTDSGCHVWTPSGPLNMRLDLRAHSPTGFNWGYGGSGPSQLALAILADAVGDVFAEEFKQSFKRAVVCRLPKNEWLIARSDVVDWVRLEITADAEELLASTWSLPSQAVADTTSEEFDYGAPVADDAPTAVLPG